jgi:hypothetical protein
MVTHPAGQGDSLPYHHFHMEVAFYYRQGLSCQDDVSSKPIQKNRSSFGLENDPGQWYTTKVNTME